MLNAASAHGDTFQFLSFLTKHEINRLGAICDAFGLFLEKERRGGHIKAIGFSADADFIAPVIFGSSVCYNNTATCFVDQHLDVGQRFSFGVLHIASEHSLSRQKLTKQQ